jgi:4-amino-4-deoxy-L-arabinose transferase-like glycosyltransferase
MLHGSHAAKPLFRGPNLTDKRQRLSGAIDRWLTNPRFLFVGGILLRLVIFDFLHPQNSDPHADVVQFIVDHCRLPLSNEVDQAYHPPLYYVLAAFVLWIFGSIKIVQVLSLVFSIATLVVIYRIIFCTPLIDGPARIYSFALACFLPQFIMFSLYVSNDSLAIFIGSLLALTTYRLIEEETGWTQLLRLAALLGLGLLTKATFLAFAPIFLILVFVVGVSSQRSLAAGIVRAFILLSIAGVVGGYKYVNNYKHFRDPFINNIDLGDFAAEQQKSFRGVQSYTDVNLLRLVASPTLDDAPYEISRPDGRGSYPLLMYGTFWYQHIPESSFIGNKHSPFKYLGSVIYLVAVIPTLIFLVGFCTVIIGVPKFLLQFDLKRDETKRLLWQVVMLSSLIGNFALLIVVVSKYHVWSVMEARLLFPSIVGGLVAFSNGVTIANEFRIFDRILKSAMLMLVALFLLYLSSEVGICILTELEPKLKARIMQCVRNGAVLNCIAVGMPSISPTADGSATTKP